MAKVLLALMLATIADCALAQPQMCPENNWVLLTFMCHSGAVLRARFAACSGEEAWLQEAVDQMVLTEKRRASKEETCQEPGANGLSGVRGYHVKEGKPRDAAETWSTSGIFTVKLATTRQN